MNNIHIERLLEFCKSQAETDAINAYLKTGAQGKAAKHLNKNKRTVERAISRVKKRAALQGYAPENDMVHTAPETHFVKGTSTLYKEGEKVLQWVKTGVHMEDYTKEMREAANAFFDDYSPVVIEDCEHEPTGSTVIPWIQIGDAHFGMMAYEMETGQNFDLKIAERELCYGIRILMDGLGEHDRCVINDLGDFTHFENMAGVTEASGHALDVDGRFTKMIPLYSRTMRFIVDYALTKFNNVDIIVNQGNHSRTNDIWMAELLRVAYGSTDRVTVLDNSSVFIPYRMGNTFVMVHHSDKCKPGQLSKVMSTDFREDWGETEYHYIDIGHIHHSMVSKEHPGVKVESWNQLAAPDKYAHDGGWRSRQSITAVKRCMKYGEVGRDVLPVEKIRDAVYDQCGIDNQLKRRKVYSV